ncbi:hypothetical protein KO529_07700 [Arenibacter algicola]|uniref:hypothetical protein n=1 Tax=Arenibacter algicola TaxID=616991 RepID=UPI001C066C5C|nr:hypothetical protein [Arenibacter algicola]MBU2904668.1 hypothetical protein [Arenibacter algicola]
MKCLENAPSPNQGKVASTKEKAGIYALPIFYQDYWLFQGLGLTIPSVSSAASRESTLSSRGKRGTGFVQGKELTMIILMVLCHTMKCLKNAPSPNQGKVASTKEKPEGVRNADHSV